MKYEITQNIEIQIKPSGICIRANPIESKESNAVLKAKKIVLKAEFWRSNVE